MMKLRILSDLHFEFWRDDADDWIRDHLGDPEADALVLAGDIDTRKGLTDTVGAICEHWEKPILWVLGNHEFYESTREQVLEDAGEIEDRYSHLHLLEHEAVTIDGQRFLGTTLWFRDLKDNHRYESRLNDFRVIQGNFRRWVYEENEKARSFLRDAVRPGDVVITHHSPTEETIPEEYENDPLNRFFVCSLEGVIKSGEPSLWIHGHHHDSSRVEIADTPVVCNPYGYHGREVNADFDPYLTETVGDDS